MKQRRPSKLPQPPALNIPQSKSYGEALFAVSDSESEEPRKRVYELKRETTVPELLIRAFNLK